MLAPRLIDDLEPDPGRRARGAPSWLPALACAALFAFAAAPLLPLAGMGPDEAVHARLALDLLRPGDRGSTWPWLPWMKDSYQGPLKSYLLLGPLALFGASPLVVRTLTAGLGAAAVFFFALFAARRYGAFLGALTGLCLAVDPALVLGASFDTAPAALALALKAAGLLGLAAWWERPSRRGYPLAAGLCFGLAVWDKSNFLWLALAAPAALALAPRERLGAALRGGSLPAAAGFCAGAFPFLLFNATHPLYTFLHPMHGGWGLAEHLAELGRWLPERWLALGTGLSGHGSYGMTASSAMPPGGALFGGLRAALLGTAALAVIVGRRAGARALREPAAWLGLILAVYAIAALSPLPVKYHHFYVVYPFPLLALAAAARRAWTLWPAARLGLALPFAAIWAFHLAALRSFGSELREAGGSPQFYRGLAGVAEWIARYRRGDPAPVYAADGLDNSLAVHLGGAPVAALRADAEPPPGSLLVAHGPGYGLDAGGERASARLLRERAQPLAVFPYADGSPWVVIYRGGTEAAGGAVFEVQPGLELLAGLRAPRPAAPIPYAARLRARLAGLASHPAAARLSRALASGADAQALMGALVRAEPAGGQQEPVRSALAALAELRRLSGFDAFHAAEGPERARWLEEARRETEGQLSAEAVAAYLRLTRPPRARFVLAPLLPRELAFAADGPGGAPVRVTAAAAFRGGLPAFGFEAFGNGLAHEYAHAALDPVFAPHAGGFASFAALRPEHCTQTWEGCVQEHLVVAATLSALAQARGEAEFQQEAAYFLEEYPFLGEALDAFAEFERRPDRYPEIQDAAAAIAEAFRAGIERRAAGRSGG